MLALLDTEFVGVDLSMTNRPITFKMVLQDDHIVMTETQKGNTKTLICEYIECNNQLSLYCNNIYEYVISIKDLTLDKFDGVVYQCCKNFSLKNA